MQLLLSCGAYSRDVNSAGLTASQLASINGPHEECERVLRKFEEAERLKLQKIKDVTNFDKVPYIGYHLTTTSMFL